MYSKAQLDLAVAEGDARLAMANNRIRQLEDGDGEHQAGAGRSWVRVLDRRATDCLSQPWQSLCVSGVCVRAAHQQAAPLPVRTSPSLSERSGAQGGAGPSLVPSPQQRFPEHYRSWAVLLPLVGVPTRFAV